MKTLAKDIMSTELICIRRGAPISEALQLLINHKITGMPVVDETGKMVGILSEYDIIRQLSGHLCDRETLKNELYSAPIEFTGEPRAIQTTTSLSVIVKKFVNNKYRRLPVVDEEQRLVGMVTRRDLMRVFYYRATLS